MTEKQLAEIFPEMTLNTNSRARIKCLVVYLRKKGYQRKKIAEIARIGEDTVTNYTQKYDESGLQGLWEENYHRTKIGCSQHPTIDQRLDLIFILFEVCFQLIHQ